MMKVCEGPGCTVEFPARGRKRFCSDRCRFQAHVRPQAAGPKKAVPRTVPPVIEKATRAELAKAGRDATAAGLVALKLAARLDASAGETLAALAAASREWSSAMERALRDNQANDPVVKLQDEVAQHRARRASANR